MKLPPYVKRYPKWMMHIPHLRNFGGNALYPLIFLQYDVYNNLLTDKPDPKWLAIIHHEIFHRKRQTEIGIIPFIFKYLLSPSYRFNEEFLAYQESMKWYKKYRLEFPINYIAEGFSGFLYLWAMPYEKAKEKLEKAWKEI